MPAASRHPKTEVNERLYTLDEIGQELGVSRERVRQIERDALVKLRRAFEARGITAADVVVGDAPEEPNRPLGLTEQPDMNT
jgi:uncharacterized protein (UPF0147 family)